MLNDVLSLDQVKHQKHERKTRRKGDAFVNIIFKMMSDGYADEIIYSYLRYSDIEEATATILSYIRSVSEKNFPGRKRTHHMKFLRSCYPDDVTVINRASILRYVLMVNSKVEEEDVTGKYIMKIKGKYPIVAWTEEVFKTFHSIIMGDDAGRLDQFIEDYKTTKISGFCAGLEQDILSVKNAIRYDVNSGFVEGNNNKFKLLKRIAYGRAKLKNLAPKCCLASSVTKREHFNVRDLAWKSVVYFYIPSSGKL